LFFFSDTCSAEQLATQKQLLAIPVPEKKDASAVATAYASGLGMAQLQIYIIMSIILRCWG